MSTDRAARAAVVLAGGRSTRMGRPKATLPFGDETLLQRVVRLCGEACDEVVVVAHADQDLPPLAADVRVVVDEVPEQGPLEGIGVGLAAATAPAAFCTACDVPFLRPALVTLLFEALGPRAAAQCETGGRRQPLLAVYRTALAPKAARLVRADLRRVMRLVEDEEVAVVAEGRVRIADPDLVSFRNLNTPEEYAAALADAGLAG